MVSTPNTRTDWPPSEVVYPESDGQPMADNSEQFAWIVVLHGNIDAIRPDDFVGGDILWYPVEGRPDIRVAPDVLVAPGRPKGKRGSYIQHREGGVPPKVVIEVLSPGTSAAEMTRKGFFYQQHGVDEFILIDPETQSGSAYVRNALGNFAAVESLDGWTSPYLGISFAREGDTLVVYRPDGSRFRSFAEMEASEAAAQRAAAEAQQATAEARREAAEARDQVAALLAKLRALGVEP